MRKFIAFILAAVMLLSFAACGKDADSEPTHKREDATASMPANDATEPTEEATNEKEITLADVMNHPETPASDFTCGDANDGGLIIYRYDGSDEIVVIPESIDGKPITIIHKGAFANDSCVKGIRLSNSVREIRDFAFTQNKNLQYVVLGDSVETVGESAFQGCKSLRDVVLNDGMKTIKHFAFAGAEALKSIIIPESVETIEEAGFYAMAEDFKIIGKAGSVAESAAASEGIQFEAN